jgi:hypothetical protein
VPGWRNKKSDPVDAPEIGGILPTMGVVLVGGLFLLAGARRKFIKTVV